MNNIKKSRVHPIGIIDSIVSLFRFFWVFLVLAIQERSIWSFVIIAGALVLAIILGCLDYYATTYEFRDGVIIYQKGVLKKSMKHINLENIQSLDTSSNVLYQVFGLVSLDINLLHDSLKLKPLRKKVALTLINNLNALKEKNIRVLDEEEKNKDVYLHLSIKDLAFYGLLRVRVIAAIGLLLAFYNKIRDAFGYIFGDKEIVDRYLESETKDLSQNLTILATVVATILLSVVIGSIIWTIIRFYNFTLMKKDNNLLCKYGLINKKSIIIDLDRIQSIKIIRPLRYRLFSMSKLAIETLTNNVSGDLSELKSTLDIMPLAKSEYVENFVKENMNLDVVYYKDSVGERISEKSRFILYRWSIINCLAVPAIVVVILFFANDVNLSIVGKILVGVVLYIVLLIYSIFKKNYRLKNNSLYYDNTYFKYVYTNEFSLITEYIKIRKVGSISSRSNLLLDRKALIHLKINSVGVNSDIKLRYYDKSYKEKLEKDFLTKEVVYE